MFGKTERSDLRAALTVAFDGDETHNCAHIELPVTDAAVQYRADVAYINVAPITDTERRLLRTALDHAVADGGDRYILFRREAETVDGAVDEVQAVVAALDAGAIGAAKTFRAGTPDIFEGILAKLGLAGG